MEPADLGTKGPWIPSGDHPLFEGTRRSTGRNTPRVKNCLAPQERWCTATWLGYWLPPPPPPRWSTSPSSHAEAAEQSCHMDSSVPLLPGIIIIIRVCCFSCIALSRTSQFELARSTHGAQTPLNQYFVVALVALNLVALWQPGVRGKEAK